MIIIFCWKNVSSFCSAKATHIFSAKNIIILYIESVKTVTEMTLNELVKLTTLWTTWPSLLLIYTHHMWKVQENGYTFKEETDDDDDDDDWVFYVPINII